MSIPKPNDFLSLLRKNTLAASSLHQTPSHREARYNPLIRSLLSETN
jgi:hypothetical protein